MTNGYIVSFPVSVGRTELFIISLILQKKNADLVINFMSSSIRKCKTLINVFELFSYDMSQ